MSATPAWPPRSLPRLYVAGPLSTELPITLDSAQTNYLGNVLRLKQGHEVLLFDGVSGEWLARIIEAGRRRMVLGLLKPSRGQESVPDVWLAFAPVKRAQTDLLIEKATELGAARLIPVITQRTIVARVKLGRLRAIATEAAEQCGRTLLPAIAEPLPLARLLETSGRTVYFADENGGEPAATTFAPGPATILTGPEGGFSDEERAAIRAGPATRAISLGPRILRAETAALAALSTYMAIAGDWR